MNKLRKIAITLGDPAGIGPEVAIKALCSGEITGICKPVIVGDRMVFEEAVDKLSLSGDMSGDIDFIDVGTIKNRDFERGIPTAAGGKASSIYIRKAVELALNKKVTAIVTAPISKEALKMAGVKWPGHTEMLAELTGTKEFAMMLCGGPLKVILVTIHTSIKKVPALITKESVMKTIRLAKVACNMMGIKNPRIAVAGLNPHAGEAGMFGKEEIKSITPAISDSCAAGISVSGPFPADTIFHKAYKGELDIIVCMYHDQGLIPLKMIAFDKGVNLTIGLPFVRTSPDHGTAYDLAWKGIADPSSMLEAIKMAASIRR